MLRFWVASILIAATCIFPSERQCSVFGAISVSETLLSQQMNGNAPFFQAFFGVFGDIERICSVFHAVFMPFFGSKVGGLNRSEWVGMLRFRHRSADLQFLSNNSGYINNIGAARDESPRLSFIYQVDKSIASTPFTSLRELAPLFSTNRRGTCEAADNLAFDQVGIRFPSFLPYRHFKRKRIVIVRLLTFIRAFLKN